MPDELNPAWEYYTPDPELQEENVTFDEFVDGYGVIFPSERTSFRVECMGCGRLFFPLKVITYRKKKQGLYCSALCFHDNRPRVTKTCPTCGTVFQTKYPSKVYCANKCVLHKHVCSECGKVSLVTELYYRARCDECTRRAPKPKKGVT